MFQKQFSSHCFYSFNQQIETTKCRMSNILAGTKYQIRVSAENLIGVSEVSDLSEYTADSGKNFVIDKKSDNVLQYFIDVMGFISWLTSDSRPLETYFFFLDVSKSGFSFTTSKT